MRGRKPLPNNLKKIRGTDEKRRMREEAIKVDKIDSLDIIENINYSVLRSERAKGIFKEKAKQLIRLNIISEIDLDQLMIYCDSLDKLYTCIEELEKEYFIEKKNEFGDIIGYVANPHLKLYQNLIPIINKLGSEFGFSPVSRLKIKPMEVEKKDKFTKLLEGK